MDQNWSRSQDHRHLFRSEQMQERRGAYWLRPRCVTTVIALKFLVALMTLTIFPQIGRLSLSSGRSFVGIRSSGQTNNESRRQLLNIHNGLSSSTASISSNDGIRGFLVHKPSDCPTLPGGTKLSVGVNVSNEAERVQHLKCILQKSSSRVGYLLNRKSRDRETVASGLPTRDIAIVEVSDDSEQDGKNLRELLDSQDWKDSYESEVWSKPGEYLMNLQIGTPPRTLKGIVDTGSDLTWVQCRPCELCYEESDPVYQPRDSSTYSELDCGESECESLSTSFCNIFTDSCDYMYSYGDYSYTYGTLSNETFTLESATGGKARGFQNITFGCSHASRGSFTSTKADGVVGLGRGSISLASQLGLHLSDRFGYCLVSRQDPTNVTSPIYFGDASILTGPRVGYTPMLTNERHGTYYYVNMTGISVGGKRLDISSDDFAIADDWSGGTILDCGTTVTNLESPAYDSLLDSFSAAVDYPVNSSETDFDLCFNVSGDPDPKFPSLVFHLDGVDLDLPQDNYMLEAEDGTMCLAIDRSSDSLNVIGNVQQQNYRITYDRKDTRVGFQPTTCAQE